MREWKGTFAVFSDGALFSMPPPVLRSRCLPIFLIKTRCSSTAPRTPPTTSGGSPETSSRRTGYGCGDQVALPSLGLLSA